MMNSLEISYRLRLKGFSQTALAEDLGCSLALINHVIRNRRRTPRVRCRISEILNLPVESIWPASDDASTQSETLPQSAGAAQQQ